MTNGLGWLSKKIKKLSQKGLTNRPFCGIINTERTKEVNEIMEIVLIIGLIILVDVSAISLVYIACETTAGKIIGSAVVILVTILITAGSMLCANESKKVWNDGYCECGGKWKLVAVCDSDYSSCTKYYICDECYKEITQ